MAICDIDSFLAAVRIEYLRARQPLHSGNSHIRRGRSRTISGVSEDLFAELLCNCLCDENLYFFVDQPLSGGSHAVYPDVIVSRSIGEDRFEILYMIDLKTDVGYHRNIPAGATPYETYVDKAKKLSNILSDLQSVPEFGVTTKSNSNNSRLLFRIHPDASYDEVVIATKNAGSKEKEAELIRFSNDPETNIWVLSTGNHPNDYEDNISIVPLYDDWNMLLNRIKENLKN